MGGGDEIGFIQGNFILMCPPCSGLMLMRSSTFGLGCSEFQPQNATAREL